jgi:hypothetical protein
VARRPAWILFVVAVVTLLRAVEVCSGNDRGGRERPFRPHAWIPFALVVSLPMAITVAYLLLPIDGREKSSACLNLAGSSRS